MTRRRSTLRLPPEHPRSPVTAADRGGIRPRFRSDCGCARPPSSSRPLLYRFRVTRRSPLRCAHRWRCRGIAGDRGADPARAGPATWVGLREQGGSRRAARNGRPGGVRARVRRDGAMAFLAECGRRGVYGVCARCRRHEATVGWRISGAHIACGRSFSRSGCCHDRRASMRRRLHPRVQDAGCPRSSSQSDTDPSVRSPT